MVHNFALLGLIICFTLISKEALGNEAYCAAKEDSGEDDQSQARRHYHTAMLMSWVDLEDESEGNCTANQTCIPDERQLLPSNLLRALSFVTAELEQSEEPESAQCSPDQDDKELDNDQVQAPLVRRVGEEGQSELAKHEALSEAAEEPKDYARALLTLRGQIVPSIVCHHNAAHEQTDDAAEAKQLRRDVGEVSDHENHDALQLWLVGQSAHFLQQK